jgi:hypothetical protein
MNKRKMWVPEIVYEEESEIPFVQVPVDKDMPDILHCYEYKLTGKFSPGPDGEEVPHMDVYIHQYIDQESIRDVFSDEMVNKLRVHIGLKPLTISKEEGEKAGLDAETMNHTHVEPKIH